MTDIILRTEGLVKKYGQRVVANHVSINVKQGEIVGLLGPNGAGKTTTIKMLTCLIQPTFGKATVGGYDVQKNPDEVRNLYSSLEFMIENERTQEAFSLLHIIIKTSGVRLPEEYRCIVDNEKLRADFVEEAIADLEDILYDFE